MSSGRPPGSAPIATALVALGAAGLALVAIVPTLLPGVSFWDTAELQTVAPVMGTAHPTGFPTYVLVGWLASLLLQPLGEPAFRMNVLSAVSVAAAAALTVVLVERLTGRLWLALVSGVLLATTPIAWSVGTHAETHSLHLALAALLLILLVEWECVRASGAALATPVRTAIEPAPTARALTADRRLVAAAIVYALALGNHSLSLLLVPGILLFVLAVEPDIAGRGRTVGVCILAALIVLVAVYAELPLRAGPFRAPLVYGRPETWNGFWAIVLAEQFRGSLVAPFSELGPKLAEVWRFAGSQLGPLVWLVPLGFLATVWRRPRYALLTGPTLVITCWFASSYLNAQIERYYLVPALIALTWVAVLVAAAIDGLEALAALAARFDARATKGGPDGDAGQDRARGPVVEIVLAALLVAPTLADLPLRHRAVDLSQDRQAEAWLDAVLNDRAAGQNAVIVSWWSYSTPLWYAPDIEHRRPDITIVDDQTRLDEDLGETTDVIDAHLGRRPVIVIQTDPAILAMLGARYRLTRLDTPGAQPVFRVDGLASGGAG